MIFEFTNSESGPMLRGSSPLLLAELLAQYESALVAAGAPTPSFRPGLSRDDIVDKLNSAGLGALEELVTWFEWHDGEIVVDGANYVTPTACMLSLENAVMRQSHSTDDVAANWGAPRGWLPLVNANFGPAIDCTGNPKDHPRLRYRNEEFVYQDDCRALSLCTLVAWWIFAIENGAHVRDPATGVWGGSARKSHPTQIEAAFFKARAINSCTNRNFAGSVSSTGYRSRWRISRRAVAARDALVFLLWQLGGGTKCSLNS